jgi:hypothetical protein
MLKDKSSIGQVTSGEKVFLLNFFSICELEAIVLGVENVEFLLLVRSSANIIEFNIGSSFLGEIHLLFSWEGEVVECSFTLV